MKRVPKEARKPEKLNKKNGKGKKAAETKSGQAASKATEAVEKKGLQAALKKEKTEAKVGGNAKITGKVLGKSEQPTKKAGTVEVKKEPVKGEKKVKRSKNENERKLEKLREALKKKSLPVFRGRFGKRQTRRKGNKKWQKWRKPRGLDILFKRDDGALPRTGYKLPKRIRFLHPSGFREAMVFSEKDLAGIMPGTGIAVRVKANIGRAKRKQIVRKALEMSLKVLNP